MTPTEENPSLSVILNLCPRQKTTLFCCVLLLAMLPQVCQGNHTEETSLYFSPHGEYGYI